MSSLAKAIAQAFTMNTMTQYLGCFIISMIPLIELRGAIPIAYWFRGLNRSRVCDNSDRKYASRPGHLFLCQKGS